VPQSATVFLVQQVVVADNEQPELQQPLQFAAASTVSPLGTHKMQFFVVSSQVVPVPHELVEQSTVPAQPFDAVPVHCVPQATATDLGTHASPVSICTSVGTSAGVSVGVSFGVSVGVSVGASMLVSGIIPSIEPWSEPASVVASWPPSGDVPSAPPSTSEAGKVTSSSHPTPASPIAPARPRRSAH
jgi:hypothetical protein